MDYSVLVANIISNDVLSKAVLELQERTKALNLITPEWKSLLENTPAYRVHTTGKATYFTGRPCKSEKAYLKPLKYKNEMYSVIVAGEWYLSKMENGEFSIVCRECEPLRYIALSMKVNDESQLHDGGRFFIRICKPSFCHTCAESHINHKVPILEKNWCVKSLRVFNGNGIKNEFTKNLQETLLTLGKFMGIMHMIIDRRTTYGSNNYKIGGIIEELIVFQNSVLLPSVSLYFGPTFDVPSIEFPEEPE